MIADDLDRDFELEESWLKVWKRIFDYKKLADEYKIKCYWQSILDYIEAQKCKQPVTYAEEALDSIASDLSVGNISHIP